MEKNEETKKMIEEYISFVQTNIAKFSELGQLTRLEEVPVDKVYKALASYYDVSLMLNTEYQRVKIEREALKLDYDMWYSERFELCKDEVISEYSSTKIKPSLTEIENRVKHKFPLEYASYQRRMTSAECECDFFIRLRETLLRQDNILTTLAQCMRSEMRALSIESRAEARSR